MNSREIENELDDKEHTADKAAPSVADLINKKFSERLSEEKQKMRLDHHARPVNCDSLVVPTVNTEVWKALPTSARKADLKTAMIKRALVKATAAIAKSTQEVLKARAKRTLTDKDVKDEVFKLNADALALLSHASKELSLKRRYAMRPYLPKSLIALCSDQYRQSLWRQPGVISKRS